jgi:type VI secretion system protein VasG
MLKAIIRLQVARIVERLSKNHKINASIDESVFDLILSRCNESDSGGRVVHSILSQTFLPQISRQLLELTLDGKSPTDLFVGKKDESFYFEFS